MRQRLVFWSFHGCVDREKSITRLILSINTGSRFPTLGRSVCRRLHLNADPRRGLAQRQDGVVLASVQPVDSQLRAGGPFHHRDVIFPPGKPQSESASPPLSRRILFVDRYSGHTAAPLSRHSPDAGVIRFLHHHGVQGPVEAHHRQVHRGVLFPGLQGAERKRVRNRLPVA